MAGVDMVGDPQEEAEAEAAERGPAPEVPTLELAEVDLLIQRSDLGADAFTLIAAGDPIPATLAELPRQPRNPEPPPETAPEPTKRRR